MRVYLIEHSVEIDPYEISTAVFKFGIQFPTNTITWWVEVRRYITDADEILSRREFEEVMDEAITQAVKRENGLYTNEKDLTYYGYMRDWYLLRNY